MLQYCVCRVTAIQGKAWCAVYAPVEPWKAWKSRRARQIWQIGANQSQWFDFDGNKMPQSCTSDWSLPSASQNSASGGTMHQKAVHQLDNTVQSMQCARDLLHLRVSAKTQQTQRLPWWLVDLTTEPKLANCIRVPEWQTEQNRAKLTDRVRRSEIE